MKSYWESSSRSRLIYLFTSFLLLFFIAAIRDKSVGTDTANYLRGFTEISGAPLSRIFEVVRWDPGYILVNRLSDYLSSNEQILLVSTTFLALIGIIIFIYKNSNDVVLSLYLYITLYMYFFSFNGIRQAIAISILVAGYHFILERKFISYLMIVLLASSFHQSAIILLGLYFIYGLKFSIKNVLIFISAFVIVFISLNPLIKSIINLSDTLNYLNTGDFIGEGTGFLFPLLNASILVFLLFIKFTNKTNYYFDFLLFIVLLGLSSSILATRVELLLRLNYYFIVYYIIAIPYAFSLVRDKKFRFLLGYFLFTVTIIYFSVRMVNGWHGIVPYLTYF